MKWNKNIFVKVMVALMVVSLETGALSQNVFAASVTATPSVSDSSEKEEVVYAILDSCGNVTGVYVVNSFTNQDVVDYGAYTSVRNLTTTDEITVDGDKITLHTEEEKVYYQGDLENKEIPWNIKIWYYLNDQEITAEELAGKNGKLKIHISVEQNKSCHENFWKGFALQASLSLDSRKCTNIVAEDATIANVGSDKQISYIILPAKGADLTITADVTDFEMDAISITGTKLNLNFDMDDEELMDKVKEIQDAIKELNDGAIELDDGAIKLNDGAIEIDDGARKLNDGAKELYDGSVDLSDGAAELNDGIKKLQDGIKSAQDGLNTLNEKSAQLTGGSAQVLDGLKQIQASLLAVSFDTEKLTLLSTSSTEVKNGIDALTAGLGELDNSIGTYYQTLAASGFTNASEYASLHETAAASLGITDTQRALYKAYMAGQDAGFATTLGELVGAGDAEATQLYMASQSDATAVVSYLTNAGKLIQIETLLKGDVNYIMGSDALISGIDDALDPNHGKLMTGAITLKTQYAVFDAGIQEMVASMGSLAKNMTDLKNGIDVLVTNYTSLDAGITEYTAAVAQIKEGYQQIYDGALQASNGTSQLYDGTKDLVDGALKLYDGTRELTDGTRELTDGTRELTDGTKELTDGTSEFYDETSDMDHEIKDTINDTIDEMTGKEVETVSFVSEKNQNVESVLFVIKTSAIEKEEAEEIVQEEEIKLTFWQKFLNLFSSK